MLPTDDGLGLLIQKVAAARGIFCEVYKESCLRRRLAVRMRARGTHSYAEYAAVLDQDPDEFDRLLKALTINVSRFYRNPETWQLLASYLPALWERRGGAVRCWSAGCASGEEPYTLAMLWLDLAGRQGWRGPLAVRIDASDIDEHCLRVAAEATYRHQAFEDLPPRLGERFVSTEGGKGVVSPQVRDLVRFHRHDLTRGAAPHAPYDLIMCRNAIIYFDRPTQEALFDRLSASLRPGGYLVLGKVETLLGRTSRQLVTENVRERIYRKL
jgi:chemotaxis methyl-accepting protein methylase